MEKVNEKKVLIISFIGVITLILVVVGATYAYFQATSSGEENINTNISSNTTDNLSFNIGNAININATEENFAQGMASLSGSTQASATLTANNYTNNATRNYYVYLNITNNNFVYTTDDNQTELFLSVTDPEGNPVTSISGLTPVTIDGVQGFDITTKAGLITIANNYEITTTSTTTQEWNITVTFVNLDSDQQANTEKSFNATLLMQENAPIIISNVTTSNITTDSITLNVEATSENTITNYYYALGDNEFVESTSNTHIFDNLDAGTEYTFRVYAVDDAGYQSAIYSINETTEALALFADYIKTEIYTGTDGDNGIYYHDGVGSYTNATEEAGDYSYRYAGANPNNYVCFGSDSATCPNDNLYRIIGVFGNQLKLIKYDYATTSQIGTNGSYYSTYAVINSDLNWNINNYRGTTNLSSIGVYYFNTNTNNNIWSQSVLNSVNLNTNYLNYLNSQNPRWAEMIESTNWKIGGMTWPNGATSTVKTSYSYELGDNSLSTVYNANIGLMYVSDYGYASSPENWTTTLYNYNSSTNTSNNWLYMGLTEWTISRFSDYDNFAFIVADTGRIGSSTLEFYGAVRPTFYLKSNVILTDGDGSSSNPYRVALS